MARSAKLRSKIATPFGRHSVPGPDGDVVELLEGLLAEARRGEIVGVAAAVVSPNQYIRCEYAGSASSHVVLAGICWLKDDFIRRERESY